MKMLLGRHLQRKRLSMSKQGELTVRENLGFEKACPKKRSKKKML